MSMAKRSPSRWLAANATRWPVCGQVPSATRTPSVNPSSRARSASPSRASEAFGNAGIAPLGLRVENEKAVVQEFERRALQAAQAGEQVRFVRVQVHEGPAVIEEKEQPTLSRCGCHVARTVGEELSEIHAGTLAVGPNCGQVMCPSCNACDANHRSFGRACGGQRAGFVVFERFHQGLMPDALRLGRSPAPKETLVPGSRSPSSTG